MHIRPARVDEVEQLSALALTAKAHWGYSAETLNSWKELLQITVADVAAKHVVVGAIGDEIVGFYSLVASTDSWKLDNLWISPNWMDHGMGRQLLAHALESASRGGAHRVTVDADPNAESFYLACGATRYGEVAAPLPGQPKRVRPQLAFDARAI